MNRLSKQTLFLTCVTVLVILVGTPTYSTVIRMDEWDYISEINKLSVYSYLLQPAFEGQFNPLFKGVYALLVFPFDYSNLLLAIFAGLIRAATFIVWFAIMRRLNCYSVLTGLLVLSIGFSYVGLVDVFQWPLSAAEEITLFFFSVALYATIRQRLMLCVLALVAGAFSWGAGVVPPLSMLAALLLTGRLNSLGKHRPFLYALCAITIGIGLIFLLNYQPMGEAGERGRFAVSSILPILRYFFVGGIINGALSGNAPLLLPGPVHLLFFLGLVVSSVWIVWVETRWERRFVILALLLTQISLQVLIALTRWHHGTAHASSYRYVYLNVFLQLPLLALVLQIMIERWGASRPLLRPAALAAAVLIFIISGVGAIRGRAAVTRLEQARQTCLANILNGSNGEACILSIYYRSDADFIRQVGGMMKR